MHFPDYSFLIFKGIYRLNICKLKKHSEVNKIKKPSESFHNFAHGKITLDLKDSRLLFEESRLYEHLLMKEIKASIFSIFLEKMRISE